MPSERTTANASTAEQRAPSAANEWAQEPLEELPPRPRRRLLGTGGNPFLGLLGVLLIACGFIGGVLVERGKLLSERRRRRRRAGARGGSAARRGPPAAGAGQHERRGEQRRGGSGGFAGRSAARRAAPRSAKLPTFPATRCMSPTSKATRSRSPPPPPRRSPRPSKLTYTASTPAKRWWYAAPRAAMALSPPKRSASAAQRGGRRPLLAVRRRRSKPSRWLGGRRGRRSGLFGVRWAHRVVPTFRWIDQSVRIPRSTRQSRRIV